MGENEALLCGAEILGENEPFLQGSKIYGGK